MAITLLGNPPTIAPVYNAMYFQVSSDKTAQEAFNFLFDVYVNGVFVNRDRLLPRPATTQAIYSPARMLESYVSYDLTQNIVDETASVNSIDKYKVIFGEEYIVYWTYTQIEEDSYNLTSFTVISGPTPHGFTAGDSVLIYQEPIPTYPQISGVHNVEAVIDDYKFTINVTYPHSSPTLGEPGTVTYSDKRKTVFITDSIVLNDATNYTEHSADWTSYGPDGCGVTAEIRVDNTLTLTVPDVSCLTATQVISWTSISPTFIVGRTYKISFTITANDPSGEGWNVWADLGGNSVVYNVDGSKVATIVCGATAPYLKFGFNLSNADTGGFGSHALKVSDVIIELVPIEYEAYDFNAVLQYEEVPTWSYLDYVPTSSSSKFLTKQPNNVKCSLTDRGSIGVLNYVVPYDPSVQYVLYVTGTDYIGGAPRIPVPIPLTIIGHPLNTNQYIVTLPAYPWNINQVSQSLYSVDVIDGTSGTYGLTIVTANPADPAEIYDQVSETKTFEIDHDCTKFEPVRFMFLNSLGQFDYYTATLLSRTTLNTSRDSFVKTLSMGYTQGDRGKTVINVNSQESYSVNTNWISESTAQWLSYELFNSSEVYILDNTDGSITPVIIDNQSIEPKKRVNDSLINYQFNYSKAVPLNTQRN